MTPVGTDLLKVPRLLNFVVSGNIFSVGVMPAIHWLAPVVGLIPRAPVSFTVKPISESIIVGGLAEFDTVFMQHMAQDMIAAAVLLGEFFELLYDT